MMNNTDLVLSHINRLNDLSRDYSSFVNVDRFFSNLGRNNLDFCQFPRINGYYREIAPNSRYLVQIAYDDEKRFADYLCHQILSLLQDCEIARSYDDATRILNSFLNSDDPNPDNMEVFSHLKDDNWKYLWIFWDVPFHPIKYITSTMAYMVSAVPVRVPNLVNTVLEYGKGMIKGTVFDQQWCYNHHIRKLMKIVHPVNKIVRRGGCCQFRINYIRNETEFDEIREIVLNDPFERVIYQLRKMSYAISNSSTTNSYNLFVTVFGIFNEIVTDVRNQGIISQGREAIKLIRQENDIKRVMNQFLSNQIHYQREDLFNYALLIGLTYMKIAISGCGIKSNQTAYYNNGICIFPNSVNEEGNKYIFSIKNANETAKSFIKYIVNNYNLKEYNEEDFVDEKIFKTCNEILNQINQNSSLSNDNIVNAVGIVKQIKGIILNEKNIFGISMITIPEKPYVRIEPIFIDLNFMNQ